MADEVESPTKPRMTNPTDDMVRHLNRYPTFLPLDQLSFHLVANRYHTRVVVLEIF